MKKVKLTPFQVDAIAHAKAMADEMGIIDGRDRDLAILDLTVQIMQSRAMLDAANKIEK